MSLKKSTDRNTIPSNNTNCSTKLDRREEDCCSADKATANGSKKRSLMHVYNDMLQDNRYKAWPCPLCCGGYSRKGDLKFHFLQKHADRADEYPDIVKARSTKSNKPFKCPIAYCPSGYMRNSDLKNHFIIKHQEHLMRGEFKELKPKQIYQCLECQVMFGRMCNLQDHYKLHHYGVVMPTFTTTNSNPTTLPATCTSEVNTLNSTTPTMIIPEENDAISTTCSDESEEGPSTMVMTDSDTNTEPEEDDDHIKQSPITLKEPNKPTPLEMTDYTPPEPFKQSLVKTEGLRKTDLKFLLN
jgi:uncharacterized Zn-finger protein